MTPAHRCACLSLTLIMSLAGCASGPSPGSQGSEAGEATPPAMFSSDHMALAATELVEALRQRFPGELPAVQLHKVRNMARNRVDMDGLYNALVERLVTLDVPVAARAGGGAETLPKLIVTGELASTTEQTEEARRTTGTITLRAVDRAAEDVVATASTDVTQEESLEED